MRSGSCRRRRNSSACAASSSRQAWAVTRSPVMLRDTTTGRCRSDPPPVPSWPRPWHRLALVGIAVGIAPFTKPRRPCRSGARPAATVGALGRIRTCNLLIRRAEVLVIMSAGRSTHAHAALSRTPTASGWCGHVPHGGHGSVSNPLSALVRADAPTAAPRLRQSLPLLLRSRCLPEERSADELYCDHDGGGLDGQQRDEDEQRTPAAAQGDAPPSSIPTKVLS